MSKVIDMNKKRMEKNAETGKMTTIPKAEYDALLMSVAALSEMHLKLIRLHEEETRLKKHHKAYLHIRDLADQVCREHREIVSGILEMFVQHDYEGAFRQAVKDSRFEPKESASDLQYEEDAGFHPGESYPGSQIKEDHDETLDDDNCPKEYRLSDGMMLMDTKTFDLMQDDVLILADTIDSLVNFCFDILDECDEVPPSINRYLESSLQEAEEAFEKWNHVKTVELV